MINDAIVENYDMWVGQEVEWRYLCIVPTQKVRLLNHIIVQVEPIILAEIGDSTTICTHRELLQGTSNWNIATIDTCSQTEELDQFRVNIGNRCKTAFIACSKQVNTRNTAISRYLTLWAYIEIELDHIESGIIEEGSSRYSWDKFRTIQTEGLESILWTYLEEWFFIQGV